MLPLFRSEVVLCKKFVFQKYASSCTTTFCCRSVCYCCSGCYSGCYSDRFGFYHFHCYVKRIAQAGVSDKPTRIIKTMKSTKVQTLGAL